MIEGDDARERFLKDALPEIINDTRLASQREKFDKKEGITETDNLQRETTEEVIKLQKIKLKVLMKQKNKRKEDKVNYNKKIDEIKKGF